MGWSKIITIEKGNLAGQLLSVGDFSGIMPFVNYTDNFSWFSQVSGQDNNFRYNNYSGYDIPDFATYITQTLGNGTHFIAGIRTDVKDLAHPLAGSFIDITISIRDVNTTSDRWSAYVALQICKRVYADDGHVQSTSYPLGNYFPEEEIVVKNTPEITGQFPWTVKGNCKILCGKLTHNGVEHLVVGLIYGHSNGNATCWSYNACRMKTSYFQSVDGWGEDAVIPDGEEYSPEYGNSSEPDGYGNGGAIGNHDKHSDHSGIPAKPQYGFTSAGFLNHYRISAQGLSMLGKALFPEPASSSPSVEVAIDRLISNQWNSKILDYVVDCRIIPVTPHDDGLHNISCGGKVLVNPGTQLPYAANLIDEDFVDVDCGYIETPLCEGNFLDFWNLKCKIFLPFYGYVDIEPEYWMGAKIGVYYRFNCMDGSFMCWVTSKAFRSDMAADDVIGQYSGNACIHLPISSQSYSQIVNGLITTGASVVGAVAGGAAGGKIAGTIASGAAAAITSRPTLNKSNSYSGSSALMSKRTPYLLIEFNEAQFSRKYVDEQGLPAVVTKTLGECEGFTQASNPILGGIPCTEAEKERIRSALASGLIFKNPVTPP